MALPDERLPDTRETESDTTPAYPAHSPPEGIPIRARTYSPTDLLALSGFTHDLNNHLCVVSAYVDHVRIGRARGDPPHDLDNILAQVAASAESAIAMVQDISELLKGAYQSRGLRPTNLGKITQTAYNLLAPILSHTNNELVLSNQSQSNILANARQLERAVHNLILNARDASTPGQSVRLETRDESIQGFVGQYGSVPQGKYGIITVKDQGSGVHPDLIKNLFKPFFTTKKKGNGLGLTVVKKVVEEHGGYIDVRTGGGTSFELYIPRTDRQLQKY